MSIAHIYIDVYIYMCVSAFTLLCIHMCVCLHLLSYSLELPFVQATGLYLTRHPCNDQGLFCRTAATPEPTACVSNIAICLVASIRPKHIGLGDHHAKQGKAKIFPTNQIWQVETFTAAKWLQVLSQTSFLGKEIRSRTLQSFSKFAGRALPTSASLCS